MNRLSITAIVLFGALVLTAYGCGKKEKSAQLTPNQVEASQETTPELPNAPKPEATTPLREDVKANSVQIVRTTGVKIIGEIVARSPGFFDHSLPQVQAGGPVKVMIFREIAPEHLETAMKWGVKVGGAYIQKGPTEYEYIRDIDLALSDEELAKQFGVH